MVCGCVVGVFFDLVVEYGRGVGGFGLVVEYGRGYSSTSHLQRREPLSSTSISILSL